VHFEIYTISSVNIFHLYTDSKRDIFFPSNLPEKLTSINDNSESPTRSTNKNIAEAPTEQFLGILLFGPFLLVPIKVENFCQVVQQKVHFARAKGILDVRCIGSRSWIFREVRSWVPLSHSGSLRLSLGVSCASRVSAERKTAPPNKRPA